MNPISSLMAMIGAINLVLGLTYLVAGQKDKAVWCGGMGVVAIIFSVI